MRTWGGGSLMSEPTFRQEMFENHVGSRFTLTDAGPPLTMVLDRLEAGPSSPRQVQYALFFRVEGDAALPQRIYHLDHAALGEMDLFLVPIGRVDETVEYQACFNHLVTSSQ
jgi:hypothetical protein